MADKRKVIDRAAGAVVGLSGIPGRFIEGLSGADEVVDLAKRLVA